MLHSGCEPVRAEHRGLNDLIGHVPTRREYPLGGYEPAVAQRHFGRPAPFEPKAGEQLVRHALELTAELFEGGHSAR